MELFFLRATGVVISITIIAIILLGWRIIYRMIRLHEFLKPDVKLGWRITTALIGSEFFPSLLNDEGKSRRIKILADMKLLLNLGGCLAVSLATFKYFQGHI